MLLSAQMTKTTSLHHHRPASPPATAVNGDADRIHSPRREGFSQWLHSHQQHEPYSDIIEPPPLHATVQHVQPPPPQPQPEEQEVHQTEQQRNASAFMAAFLRDAASGHRDHGDGPTRNYVSHKTVPIPTKGMTIPTKTRFVRSASNGSAKSGCSSIASIGSLSECLNEVARSSGETAGEFVVRTKTSGNKGKRGCRSLNNSLTTFDATGDDVSVVSNISDWNELVEKTFYGHSNDDNVRSQWENTHKDRHVEEGKSKHHSGEEDCSEGKRLNQQQQSPQSLKPILKVKEVVTTSLHGSDLDVSYLDASGRSNMTDIERLDDFFKDVLEARDLHVDPEERELDEMMKNPKDSKQNHSKHEEIPRPALSMGDMVHMMNNLFDDESGEPHSCKAEGVQKASGKERVRADRLRKKKAAAHTRAVRDSPHTSTRSTAPDTPKQRSRMTSYSYDEADSFRWSPSKASKWYTGEENTVDGAGGRLNNPSATRSKSPSYHIRSEEGDTQSFNVFDDLLKDVEDEERRIESKLFGTYRKQSSTGSSFSKQKRQEDMDSRSVQNSVVSSNTGSGLSSRPTKVICLQWVDRRGMVGHFTGDVNEMIQPHGRGVLVYENGMVLDCHWCNGTPSAEVTDETASSDQKEQGRAKNKSRQFHPDYDLGMAARSRHDMVENDDPEKTMESISRLEMWDFAFVRRTNNKWTYSIISDRTEDTIRFVVDGVGRTKMIDRKGWLKNIRCLSQPNICPDDNAQPRARRPRRRSSQDDSVLPSFTNTKKLEP